MQRRGKKPHKTKTPEKTTTCSVSYAEDAQCEKGCLTSHCTPSPDPAPPQCCSSYQHYRADLLVSPPRQAKI